MVVAAPSQRRRLSITRHCNKQDRRRIAKEGDPGAAGTMPPCRVVRREKRQSSHPCADGLIRDVLTTVRAWGTVLRPLGDQSRGITAMARHLGNLSVRLFTAINPLNPRAMKFENGVNLDKRIN